MTTVTAETFVHAPLKFAYRAFTNATSMREWLCDVATVAPHPHGRIYLWWAGDFYSSGHYLELEENKRVKFRWFSNIDPAPTEVTVTFTEKDGGVNVRMDHDVPQGEAWQGKPESFRENWQDSLRNLKSVLETGIDLRIAERPMLGIVPGDFSEEQAIHLGIPVREGLRLDATVEGMGAKRAGLERDDLLVSMAGKTITNDFTSLQMAIAGKKGGDVVEVEFYRGAEKKKTSMELTKRPMADVPFNPVELAKQARALFEPALAEIEKCFEGYTDEQAMKRPEPNEWSALEVVAHLIQGERFNASLLSALIDGYEPTTDGFGSNINASVAATVKANPSIKLMMDALRRSVEEILFYVEMIPEEFVANKGSYYRFGSGMLQPGFHLNAHTEQMRKALEDSKK
ncbi:MAG: SRPBCC domain-containing protein [Anaerolineae bacterium]|nr:SRPBCC domain-containing protein [Anaerolineae bacterium]